MLQLSEFYIKLLLISVLFFNMDSLPSCPTTRITDNRVLLESWYSGLTDSPRALDVINITGWEPRELQMQPSSYVCNYIVSKFKIPS